MVYKADRRLYVTADRKRVVEADDPEAAFLLLPEGGEMPDAEAKMYGLDSHKQVRGAPENKSRARSADDEKEESAGETVARAVEKEVDNTLTSQRAGVRGAARAEPPNAPKRS